MARQFQRKIEDFVCENCGAIVHGNGYTNNCPACLSSKDVDINPGDRASKCGGMMAPISAEPGRTGYVITHRCAKCGKVRKNKSADNDSFDAILKLVTRDP